jgi:MFS transporter, DHA1 family, tetracycline resistance protein
VNPPQPGAVAAPPTRRFRSPLLPIFLIVVVDVLGFTIILPLLPFFSERLGASPATVGTIVAIYAVFQLLAGPVLGQLSDRIGRKPVLLISQAGTLAGFLLLAFSSQIWMVFLSRAIDGATAGNLSTAQAYISDVTRPENRAKSFAIIGVAFGFGFLVGPAISGFLAHYGFRAPIFAAAALSLTSILCTTLLLPAKPPTPAELGFEEQGSRDEGETGPGGKRLSLLSWGEYRRYFRNPALAKLLVQWLLFALSFSTFISGFALFAERRYVMDGRPIGLREVGYIFAFNGFIGIIMQGGLVGWIVKAIGEKRTVQIGFFSSAFGAIGVGLSQTVPQLLWIIAISAIGAAGLRPALTSMITQQAGRREQGVILGLTQSLTSVGQITAPVIAGLLIDRGLLTEWGFWGGILALAALLFSPPISAARDARI